MEHSTSGAVVSGVEFYNCGGGMFDGCAVIRKEKVQSFAIFRLSRDKY